MGSRKELRHGTEHLLEDQCTMTLPSLHRARGRTNTIILSYLWLSLSVSPHGITPACFSSALPTTWACGFARDAARDFHCSCCLASRDERRALPTYSWSRESSQDRHSFPLISRWGQSAAPTKVVACGGRLTSRSTRVCMCGYPLHFVSGLSMSGELTSCPPIAFDYPCSPPASCLG